MSEEQAITFEQPRVASAALNNQRYMQFTNNSSFYSMIPAPYFSYYNNWVRVWLQWYDGYVPWIHGSQFGILSTHIATTLVNRASDSIFGGSIKFENARVPNMFKTGKSGKPVSTALDFISCDFQNSVKFQNVVKKAIRYDLAGGGSLLKLNNDGSDLWIEALRADRFLLDMDGRGKIIKSWSVLSFYNGITPQKSGNLPIYMLIEERRYERIGAFGQEIPVVEYKMYETSSQIQDIHIQSNSCIRWEDLPKEIREAFKREYGFRLNEPKALNGFSDLGVYLLKSEENSAVPQIKLGESMLSHILTYLYEYDFYNTCFNTDMYLARGRVIVPKHMQSPSARAGNQPSGLDDFLYTQYEGMNNEADKPLPIQFELRAESWKEARNLLLESIATGIGMSVSTVASYISDGSNRTAREVSAEESATALFIVNHQRAYTDTLNDLLKTVLRYYGYTDDVEVRWSKAGMTNLTVLTETLAKAKEAGLISGQKAHQQYNYDDDEEQNNEDYALVEKDKAQNQNSIFGE